MIRKGKHTIMKWVETHGKQLGVRKKAARDMHCFSFRSPPFSLRSRRARCLISDNIYPRTAFLEGLLVFGGVHPACAGRKSSSHEWWFCLELWLSFASSHFVSVCRFSFKNCLLSGARQPLGNICAGRYACRVLRVKCLQKGLFVSSSQTVLFRHRIFFPSESIPRRCRLECSRRWGIPFLVFYLEM